MYYQKNIEDLDKSTREARIANRDLDETAAGQLGQVATDIAVSAPLTALSGGTISPAYNMLARLGPKAKKLFGPLSQAISSDAAAGAMQGALRDTTSDESTISNAAEEGIIGGLIPGGGRLAEKISGRLGNTGVGVFVKGIGTRIGGGVSRKMQDYTTALKEYGKEGTRLGKDARAQLAAETTLTKERQKLINKDQDEAHKRAVEQARIAAKDEAKRKLEALSQTFDVKVTPEFSKELTRFGQKYPKLVSGNSDLRTLISAWSKSTRVPGPKAMAARAQILREAKQGGAGALQLEELQRLITDEMYKNMPSYNARALRETYGDYRGVREGAFDPVKPPPLMLAIPQLRQTAQGLPPVHPDDMPYSRDTLQRYLTGGTRAALYPGDVEDY
jgi:hypothetical protein